MGLRDTPWALDDRQECFAARAFGFECRDGDRRQSKILWLDENEAEILQPIQPSIGRGRDRHFERSFRRVAPGFEQLVERELRMHRNEQDAEKAACIPHIIQMQQAPAREPFERRSKAGRRFWRECKHDEERQKWS